MGTLIGMLAVVGGVLSLIWGFTVVLAKLFAGGVKATYDYTARHVEEPIVWLKDSTVAHKVQDKTEKAEAAARLLIQAMKELNK